MSFITWQVGILEAPGSQELLNSHFGFSFHLPKVGTNVLTLISSSKWEESELSLVGWDLLAKLLGAQQQEQGESCVAGASKFPLMFQWHRTATTQETDGFQVKRPGDVNVRCTVLLMLDYQVA